ncbi:MAG: STAS domain-containing protein [Bacteroidales bacterium]|nr:STAS domain-containing protein [Bacteroidales bacterium]
MEYTIKTDDVKGRFREYEISGDISVQNIEQLMESMSDCVEKCDSMTINLNQITGFDTAAFQFFCSLRNSFDRDKKTLKVHCTLSQETAQLLSNCGISDLPKFLSTQEE